MRDEGFFELFTDELKDMLSSENQIVDALPKLIQKAQLKDLKKGLSDHLEETKHQVERLDECFKILDIEPEEITCEAMEGLIKEANELTENKSPSPVLDAAIISACQKVEHYEIASYGTLIAFAKNLGLDKRVVSLLKETITEEGNADKALTKIAEGGIFTSGVNKEAVSQSPGQKVKSRR